jgi:site-specific recombinase XerD
MRNVASCNIRVIQNLLGHSSHTATMIYTHCVLAGTVKKREARGIPDDSAAGT